MQYSLDRPIAPCPHCSADGSKRTWRKVTGGNAAFRILSDAHRFNGSDIVALVCKNCGYSEFFTDPQDFN